jgi:hypothetical protein
VTNDERLQLIATSAAQMNDLVTALLDGAREMGWSWEDIERNAREADTGPPDEVNDRVATLKAAWEMGL